MEEEGKERGGCTYCSFFRDKFNAPHTHTHRCLNMFRKVEDVTINSRRWKTVQKINESCFFFFFYNVAFPSLLMWEVFEVRTVCVAAVDVLLNKKKLPHSFY